MSPRTLPALAIAAGTLLALAPAAAAKEIQSARACGADGCRNVTALITETSLEGGPPGAAPHARAPFYVMRYTMREGPQRVRFSTIFVPSAGKIRNADGRWMNPPESSVAELRRAVRDITPYPAARLPLPPPLPASALPASAPPARDTGGGVPVLVWALLAAAGIAALAGAARMVVLRRGSAPSAG